MINTYSPWGELTALPDLTLEWRHLVGRVGEYIHAERKIHLDPRAPRRQLRSVLCHELRHAEAGDSLTVCERVNLRQEQTADQRAARLMVDINDLADAMMFHGNHLSAIAVELRVSDALLRVRRDHLHPSEKAYLRRRLADS